MALIKRWLELSTSDNNNSGELTKSPGVQKGHKGVTNIPKPTETKIHQVTVCPNCNSTNLTKTKVVTQDTTEIPLVVQSTTTRNITTVYM